MEVRGNNPFAIGWKSVRANAVPMIALWMIALIVVLSYYLVPGIRASLEPLAKWQTEGGWYAAFLNRVVFCGVIPGLFLLLIRALRPRRPFLTIALQSCWCGLWGIVVDWFFSLLDQYVGSGADWATLAVKTSLDEFLLTPLLVAPADAVFFFWLGRDMSMRRVIRDWPTRFVTGLLAPNLISNWCVWVPAGFAIFAFPLPLQVQISGFLSSMWALMCLQIGVRSAQKGGGTVV